MKRRPRRHVDQDRRSCRDHRVDRGGGDIPDESQLSCRLSDYQQFIVISKQRISCHVK